MADPWFKFYPTDWRSDPALRMCSPAARGVWIDMICLMHEASPYGHLLVSDRSPTDAQLSVLLGIAPDQLTDLLGELEAAAVFSRTSKGVIYSRKLTRMAKKAATARNNGRKGGNPKLSKEREKSASDNPPDKGQDKPQKLEARSQSKEREAKASQKKKTRIPENAVISEAQIRAAAKRGHSLPEAEAQFQRFKNDALAKGKLFLCWDRAFVTWLDSPYFKPITAINGGQNEHSKPDPTLDAIAIAARMRRTPGASSG